MTSGTGPIHTQTTIFHTSIKNKHNSASDASVGAHDLASYGLYQRTNQYDNTDVNDNDDLKSFETPREIIRVLPVLVIQSPQQPHKVVHTYST